MRKRLLKVNDTWHVDIDWTDHDIVVSDTAHPEENSLCLTKDEWKRVIREIQEILDNPCGKPHNNGEESCNECITIKDNDPVVQAQYEAWKAERDYNA